MAAQPKLLDRIENDIYRVGILAIIVLVIAYILIAIVDGLVKTFGSLSVGIAIGVVVGAILMHVYHTKVRSTP